MKLLLDSCVWGGAVTELREAGYYIVWIGEWAEDPGDEEIITYAYKEGCVLVTLDKDFGELAIMHGMPHHGIIRLVNFSVQDQAKVCIHIITIQRRIKISCHYYCRTLESENPLYCQNDS